jgi:20S proteasome alpha/beta subunit
VYTLACLGAAPLTKYTRDSLSATRFADPVTFVVSLFNQTEIVIAADTLALDGSLTPMDKACHKIKRFGPHVFAASGTNAGYDLRTHVLSNGMQIDSKIEVAAHQFYAAAKDAYEALDLRKRKYNETSILLAGFGDDGPDVYILKLPDGGLDSQQCFNRASLGIGTLSEFFRNHHTEEMTTNQRIQLAHFCVSLTAAKNGSMVKEPIDLAVLTQKDGLKIYETETNDNIDSFVKPFQERSATMISELDSFFLALLPTD